MSSATIAEMLEAGLHQKQASSKEFFTPRDYQLELLDAALDHNCIVSLGTGFGKTYIAILLIKEYADVLIQREMKAFFVVDKVSLAEQQKLQLELHTNLPIGIIHGQMNTATWEDPKQFGKLFKSKVVFVVTHAILNQLLQHAIVKWTDIALLIVDECHHVLGSNHEYRKLMNYYRELKDKSQRPRVLGLTATVVNSKVRFEKIEDMIHNLEVLMCARLEMASSVANLAKYGPKPFELIVEYSAQSHNDNAQRLCLSILTEAEEQVHTFNFACQLHKNDELLNSIKDCARKARSAFEILGPWSCFKICHLYADQFKKARSASANNKVKEQLIVYAITVFQQCLACLEHLSRWQKNQEDLKPYASNQVHRIVEILYSFHERLSKEKPLSAIVFVRERHIAFLLSAFLNRLASTHDTKYKFIKADYIIGRQGFSVSNAEELMVANKRQEQTIYKFRTGALNVLISTSVLEEGIDVKSCNCVIRAFPPDDFRAYIQSRGRARAPNAIYCLLCPEEESLALNERLNQFNSVEQILLSRFTTSNNAIDTLLPAVSEKMYEVESTGARVTLQTSIALVNRYCAKLPSDVFTRLVPEVNDILVEQPNGQVFYKAELLLPINAPIKKPIRLETPVHSLSLARMSVALMACEILHKNKELTDNLLPAGKDSIVQDFLNEVVEDDEYMTGVAGRNIKKRRLYDRKVTRTLTKSLAQAGRPCNLYIIDIRLTEPLSAEENLKNRRIIDPHEDITAFGFICTSELPSITHFPVFLRQGKTEVSFVKAASQKTIDAETMSLIYEFHSHIFEDILRVAKSAVAFSPENSCVPLLIVPLIKKLDARGLVVDAELDRSRLLPNIRRIEPVPTDEQRKEYKFDKERFKDAVVLPWYRVMDSPCYYYVAEICHDCHPGSRFPDEKYQSFNEYFVNKYELEIYDQAQPLLDVDRASERMNLILPRAPSSSRAKKQSYDPTQRQILVPELVHVHPLSATYWTMIIALPTILYRLNQFLLIDELRTTIIQDAFKVDPKTPSNFEWPKLNYETQNTNSAEKSIRNIAQLRQTYPAEEAQTTEKMEESLSEAMSVCDEPRVFDIGYWDPNEAGAFKQLRADPFDEGGNNPEVDKIGEQAALGKTGYEMDMSDGEEIEEYEINTDYNELRRAIGEREAEPFQQQELANVFGWESEDNNAHIENTEAASSQNGLIALIGADGIDLRGLMTDLQNEFNNMNKPYPSSSSSLSNHEPPTKCIKIDRPTAIDIPSRREGISRADEEFVDEALIEMPVEHMPAIPESIDDDIRKNTVTADQVSSPNDDLDWLVNGKFEVTAPKADMSFTFEDNLSAAREREAYGVPPALLLQALTTASASDGINLERLETIGDSFLKLSVTNFLYFEYALQHEGKLSYARSKEVSNTNLFKIGKSKNLPSIMEASKFDPNVSWLPPGYVSTAEFHAVNWLNPDEEIEKIRTEAENAEQQTTAPKTGWEQADQEEEQPLKIENGIETINLAKISKNPDLPLPHNTMTQQCINDKSVADTVEALIGAHLTSLGLSSTLKFMEWLGIKVMLGPRKPDSPLLQFMDTEEDSTASIRQLHSFYVKHRFEKVEERIGYRFGNKAFLVQAFTHASYYRGRVTGCYQRLEFLGDAVLDYLVTRFLFEHKGRFAPGILTDLRSSLVNNTIFASLAVKHGLHKFFLSLSNSLAQKINKFVEICEQNQMMSHGMGADCPNFNTELFMVTTEEEVEDGHEEDVEVPKALGDIFESLAGAIFLDSGMNLDVVWRVYYQLMRETIEECCRNPPLSPVRELFELKGNKARFAKLERVIETNKIRVTVEIDQNLRFEGMGRSFRLAKATAAKRALKYLRSLEEQRRHCSRA